jgi:tRNA dimethylallyltransferase
VFVGFFTNSYKLEDKTIIIIVGPTAVGKTKIALELAQRFNTKIISADSRQCFRELEKGVAKPSQSQLDSIQHYFINSHSIEEEVNAAVFEKLALKRADEIFLEHEIAIMVGGTGLYIKGFCEGLDEMPAIDPSIRREIQIHYEQDGLGWLQEEIRINDPGFYKTGEILNPQRLMRALEVKLATGSPISSFRLKQKKPRPFQMIKTGLLSDKGTLHHNIDNRVDAMMEAGLLDEVKSLLPYRHLNALQTVGYAELFSCLDGMISLEQAIDLIKKNTKRYAKRQTTWFKKDSEIKWLDPGEAQLLEKITQS